MIDKKIGIIGGGNMGEALLASLATVIEKSTALMVSEFDAARRDYLQTRYKIIVEIDNNYLSKYSDIIILAVKPKDITSVLEEIRGDLTKAKALISIAAGITTSYIERLVGEKVPVTRVMPNMPALIGEAVSSISPGRYAGKADVAIAREIFSLMGEVIEVDEKLVDAVTAVSGSGPAYFFYFVESLIEAAREIGLDEETARLLVLETFSGSAKLLKTVKEAPETLRAKVTSKGGTTEAAIKVFESRKVKEILKEAVAQAHNRSKELSKG